MTKLPPVRRGIDVSVSADRAWEAFTTEMAAWWPLATHGCTGEADAALSFVGDDLVETGSSGEKHIWGTVLRREPPRSLVMTWHPARAAGDPKTEVEWLITPVSENRCRIEVIHRAWENLASPEVARDAYENGWPPVLERLAELLDT